MTAPVLLSAHGIGKSFGGVRALHDIHLTLRAGEIYGLIGPNGAGKTSFFNTLTGLYRADSGHFEFAGQRLDTTAPHRVAAAGIARTFQNIRLFANMTALENVMVGRHLRSRSGILAAILRHRRRPQFFDLRFGDGHQRAFALVVVPDRLVVLPRGERPLRQDDQLQKRLPFP